MFRLYFVVFTILVLSTPTIASDTNIKYVLFLHPFINAEISKTETASSIVNQLPSIQNEKCIAAIADVVDKTVHLVDNELSNQTKIMHKDLPRTKVEIIFDIKTSSTGESGLPNNLSPINSCYLFVSVLASNGFNKGGIPVEFDKKTNTLNALKFSYDDMGTANNINEFVSQFITKHLLRTQTLKK